MILTYGISTPLYYYSLIPLGALLSLYAVNGRELLSAVSSRLGAKPDGPAAPLAASAPGWSTPGFTELYQGPIPFERILVPSWFADDGA
jgi:hypothetical protein